jgi:hypothetical protein
MRRSIVRRIGPDLLMMGGGGAALAGLYLLLGLAWLLLVGGLLLAVVGVFLDLEWL